MKRVKKYFALFLCVMMIASMGLSANAATSFSFYVDAVGGTGAGGYVVKESTTTYAKLNFTTFSYNGPSGGLISHVKMSGARATANYSLTSGGSKTWSYRSGYTAPGNEYWVYGSTTASCGYGARLGGTWTP